MTGPLRPPRPGHPFLQRVKIKDFRSIARCDVALGSLVALVGRNGSGKSNFLDALRFTSDGLTTTLDHALRERGGISEVRRHSTGHPRNFSIELDFRLEAGARGRYAFEIAGRQKGGFTVKREVLTTWNAGRTAAFYRVEEGRVVKSSEEIALPRAVEDRLFLVTASGLPAFRPVYDALVSMGFYNLNPEAMKRPQSPDAGELLHRDGSNIASVIARLHAETPKTIDRIRAYLSTIVPGIMDFRRSEFGPQETLEFRQEVKGSEKPWRFFAMNMSDGTLRALGILVAVAQLSAARRTVPFVGIEEPETALHPAAIGSLVDALREAASSTQLALTTHSPDVLESLDLDHDTLIVVQLDQGRTDLATIDPASREAIRDHLYTAGDLLRLDQIQLDPAEIERQRQTRLFELPETGSE